MTFKNIIFIICSCFATFAKAQHLLFEPVDIYTSKVTAEQVAIYESYKKNPHVLDVSLVKVAPPALGTEQIQLSHQGFDIVANKVEVDERDATNWAWFGQLSDETDIFLTVMKDKVFSKFYLKSVPYTLLPLNEGYHLLIGFDNEAAITKCDMGSHKGKEIHLPSKSLQKQQKDSRTTPTSPNTILVDDDCRLRILIAYTTATNNQFDMGVLGQALIDETNLAYIQSGVNFRVELARVVAIDYTENGGLIEDNDTYGEKLTLPTDLVRLRNGTTGFGAVTQLRNAYQADVVALIRNGAFTVDALGSTAFGVAFGVLNGNFVPDVSNAFFGVGNTNNTTLIAGRFTFAHELGHTQGARHGDDNRTPTFARGFVINTAFNGVRTLMCTQAEGGGCNTPQTGCRVQRFSNPDILFGGIPMGTVANNNNARRLNETSINMRNLIMTLNDLVVQNETLANEVIANHLAHNTITSNGNVISQNGSRLNMRAANTIRLTPGFHAQAGSIVVARLVNQPCTVAPRREDGTITGSTNLGKEQNVQLDGLKIYPNPANNFCTIELVNPIQQVLRIELYDHLGRKTLHIINVEGLQIGTHQYTINTESLQVGTYFAKVSLGDKVFLKQITIQK